MVYPVFSDRLFFLALSDQCHLCGGELAFSINEAAAGHLDDLECPKCRQAAVSVWFTHPANDVY